MKPKLTTLIPYLFLLVAVLGFGVLFYLLS